MRIRYWIIAFLFAAQIAAKPMSAEKSLMPLVEAQFEMVTDSGQMLTLSVGGTKSIEGIECTAVEWSWNGRAFQTEYFFVKGDSVFNAGTLALGHLVPYTVPLLMVKESAARGDTWTVPMGKGAFTDTARFLVEGVDTVVTKAGRFPALRVSMSTKSINHTRWYARGIGMIKESRRAIRNGVVGEMIMPDRTLSRVLPSKKDLPKE